MRSLDDEQVDERIADRDKAECGREDERAAKRRVGENRERLSPPSVCRRQARSPGLCALVHEQRERRDAEQGHDERREEDDVVAARQAPKEGERQHRSGGGACRIQRPVHAKRGRKLTGAYAERNHRVTRRGADGLSKPIDQHEPCDRGDRAAREREPPQTARRRQPVAKGGRQLSSAGSIGDEASGPCCEDRSTLMQPGHEAEREWGQAACQDQIRRQHADHHLG